jgi:HK97 family phage major capsid protein
MTAAVAMRRMRTTIVTTDGGEPKQFPKVSTHGIATQVANQNTAFAGTDPVLATMTLNAYDAGQLITVSNDLLEDTAANIVQFVAEQLGRGIGELTSSWYITGAGSTLPNGIENAIVGAGTISTGGSLIDPTVEKYIDLVYSVNGNYRARGAEWLMRDLTAAAARKLRDGAGGTIGACLWQPSPTVGRAGGEPDKFLGYPVFTDPNVASLASNAKIAYFGDFSAYYIRDVRGVRLERSDDIYFDKNQVAFRGLLRTDGDLVDTAAINTIKRSV